MIQTWFSYVFSIFMNLFTYIKEKQQIDKDIWNFDGDKYRHANPYR